MVPFSELSSGELPREKEKPEGEEIEISRSAAQITLARINNYQELWAETEEEGDKKFIQKTRELWKEFAIHGVVGLDKKTGEKTILNFTDLDGKCSLVLLKMAGINTMDVKYVAPSEFIRDRINLDTGDRFGLVIEDEGKTVFFDHHKDNTGRVSSATEITYEVLTGLRLLKKENYLTEMVRFVTQVDNRTFPEEEKYFRDSWRTVLGLQRFIVPTHLLNFFKAERSPVEILSPKDLKEMGLVQRSEEQKRIVEASLRRLEQMEKDGLIVDSESYGKIVVDIGKTVPAGFDAAKAIGCGGYVIWNPREESFFICTTTELKHKFSQGIKVRDKMWIKPRHDKSPLTVSLREVLDVMTDNKVQPQGKLKELIEKK